MSMNIWQQLPKPIFVLAPMADVTDAAFRAIINKYGQPDLFFTEFVSADGLVHPTGREKLKRELYFTSAERPIIAQLFGGEPAKMKAAATYVATLGFAGIDLNMGCPDRSVERQQAGASLIKDPARAVALIEAVKEGAGGLPVSVKTRIGYNHNELATWTESLLKAEPAAITFHLRTRKEMSKVSARWEDIKLPVALAAGSQTLILGNGDVKNLKEAREKVREYDVAGVMLGRAIYGNPWLWSERTPALPERLAVLKEHTNLFWDLYGPTETNLKLFNGHRKSFAVMKKHFKAYVEGFAGAAELRADLMKEETAAGVAAVLDSFLATG